MPYGHTLVVLRGGGDLATGVAFRLTRRGFPVVVCELEHPLAVRRTVALASALAEGSVVVEGMRGIRAGAAEAAALARQGVVPVVASPGLPGFPGFPANVVVDARMSKRPSDTTIGDAPFVVGLGPGFVVGANCHAVVETMRGPALGRVLWSGSAEPDTGIPGERGGHGADRVLRAPAAGRVVWRVRIGDRSAAGDVLGSVNGSEVVAPFAGLVRGLISEDVEVRRGMKIGDVDPRPDAEWRRISDKALAVGDGALEAILEWWHRDR